MRNLLVIVLSMMALAVRSYADSTPKWIEIRSPHFIVISDSNEKEARKTAGQFERMRSMFKTLLPHAGGDASLPITVLALKDKKGFQSLVPASYLAKGQIQLAGYFLRTQDRNYILMRLDAEVEHPFSTIYHEYTHFILRKADYFPLWLDEGLAEFYQNTDIYEKEVLLGQPSGDNLAYLRQQRLLPLATLFTVGHNSPYYHDEQKGSVFYAESWALTHYIEITDFQHKTERLQNYVLLLSKHEDPVLAAQHAFGDLKQLQKELDNYVSQSDYQMFKLNLAVTAADATFQAKPITVADANAVRADVLANNERPEEAKSLLEAVLRDDPKNSQAHETMGTLAYRNHDLAGAKKWYAEAVQLDSQSYIAYYNFAVMSLMDNDRDKDDQIESSLRESIKLEPGFAPAYDALAHFLVSRRKNLEEAYLMSLHACQLEPENINYRINSAQVLVDEKNFDSALRVLHEAEAHVAKTPEDTARIGMQISQIEQYRDSLAKYEAASKTSSSTSTSGTSSEIRTVVIGKTFPVEEERTYPTPAPSAPKRVASGVLHDVKCSYPSVLTFSLDQPQKSLMFFSKNYFEIPFTAANFQPEKNLDPCKAINGLKAKVAYSEVQDKSLTGQIVSIELSK